MRQFLIFIISFSSVNTFAQVDSEEAANTIMSTCITTDKSGNSYIAGSFEGVVTLGRHTLLSKGQDDIFIAKYSPDGKCLWATRDGGKGSDYASTIGVDNKGNVFIAGRFGNNAAFDLYTFKTVATNEFFVAKYNYSGDLLFVNRSQGDKGSDNIASSIVVTEKGECFVSASLSLPTKIGNEILKGNCLLKFSSTLKYIGASKVGGEVTALARDKKGDIYLTGYFDGIKEFCGKSITSEGLNDIFISKINSSGKCMWTKQLGGESNDIGKNITIDGKGNVIIVGEFNDSIIMAKKRLISYGDTDILWAKYSSGGELLWANSGGSTQFDEVNGVQSGSEGNIYITGKIGGDYADFGSLAVAGIIQDAYILKSNSKGKILWGKLGIGNNECVGIGISGDNKNNIYAVGNFDKKITFDKKSLVTSTAGNCVYLVRMNSKDVFSTLVKVGESDASFDFDPNANYIDVKGKLLAGKKVKKPIVNQIVSLFGSAGDFLESTNTDVFGDFSFKNVDSKKNYNIDFGKNDSIPLDEPIYLAKQSGEIISPVFRNKEGRFKFEILKPTIHKMSLLSEVDPVDAIKDFLKEDSKEKIVTDNIYYAENDFSLSNLEKKRIYHIVKTLKSHKNLYLEISSYTDARGDDDYNMDLSKKRAVEVRDYFISRGVSEDRIQGNGYGETGLLNRCSNDVSDCSEREHSLNRRTEFKFIKN
jgi:outer membrane protein OmpA-like peptidoglycan-associated protein